MAQCSVKLCSANNGQNKRDKNSLLAEILNDFTLFTKIVNSFFWFSRHDKPFDVVMIALVGKYTELEDSYNSVTKALQHSTLACKRKLEIKVIFGPLHFKSNLL